jgi:hypothetical protein
MRLFRGTAHSYGKLVTALHLRSEVQIGHLNVEREVHIISNAAVHEPVIIFVLQEGLAGAIYGYN